MRLQRGNIPLSGNEIPSLLQESVYEPALMVSGPLSLRSETWKARTCTSSSKRICLLEPPSMRTGSMEPTKVQKLSGVFCCPIVEAFLRTFVRC